MNRADPAIQWLLKSNDPSIHYFTLVDLLDVSPRSRAAIAARREIPNGARVRALLAEPKPSERKINRRFATHPGSFGDHPYKKWNGAHWRLVSLVELGIPSDHPRAHAAADQVLTWLVSDDHRGRILNLQKLNGRWRRCASQEGNALAVCSRLGMTNDPRVQFLAQSLIEWQWDDGGWNCDKNPAAHHSSFYESLAPLWGLVEYHRVTGDKKCAPAIDRAAELFLRHRLFRSEKTGAVIDNEWLKLHYPLYYHYDVLQALVILARAGKIDDARCGEALDIIEQKRGKDGCWRAEGFFWKPKDLKGLQKPSRSNIEVVDWGRRGANEMITLNALRVLKAADRI
jgi:hypothetical protein